MARSITTSVRLPPELRDQLEQAAQALHRGKNWIMIQALQDYLINLDNQLLAEEAKKQSLAASQYYNPDDDDWENNIAIHDDGDE